jgi:transposase
LIVPAAPGQPQKERRTLRTRTADLLEVADWLTAAGCTHIAMESTGVYWKPIYNVLEGQFVVLVVNAQHVKAVPGRKTDVREAEWLADLLRHGLLQGSFIPSAAQRALRDLTRQRSPLVQERARIVNRLHKVLEDANSKLAGVATDVLGVSGRARLEALLAGQTDPATLAELARGRLREKRPQREAALAGRLHAQQRFMLLEHLEHIDYLDAAIARLGAQIAQQLSVEEEAAVRLDSIPGGSQRVAEILVAEVGSDPAGHFPRAQHLASWAGVCPGNHQSAGKRLSGKTRKGSRWLRHALTEAAQAAARSKHPSLSAQYHRLAARRGKRRAVVAVAHTILVIAYHLLTRKETYRDLGATSFDDLERQYVERRLVRRLQRLGYQVEPTPAPQSA